MTRRNAPRRTRIATAFAVLALAACGSDDTASGNSRSEADVTIPDTDPTDPPATDPPATPRPTTTAPVLPTTTDVITAPDASPQERLDAAIARWNEVGPASYTMVTRPLCFCVQQAWQDTIVDGVVTAHVQIEGDAFSDPGPVTMASLYADLQAVIDEGFASLDVSFDPKTGALQRFFVDLDEMIADEEFGIEVVSLSS